MRSDGDGSGTLLCDVDVYYETMAIIPTVDTGYDQEKQRRVIRRFERRDGYLLATCTHAVLVATHVQNGCQPYCATTHALT